MSNFKDFSSATVGKGPNIFSANTTDSLALITTPGYLRDLKNLVDPADIFLIRYSWKTSAQDGGVFVIEPDGISLRQVGVLESIPESGLGKFSKTYSANDFANGVLTITCSVHGLGRQNELSVNIYSPDGDVIMVHHSITSNGTIRIGGVGEIGFDCRVVIMG